MVEETDGQHANFTHRSLLAHKIQTLTLAILHDTFLFIQIKLFICRSDIYILIDKKGGVRK